MYSLSDVISADIIYFPFTLHHETSFIRSLFAVVDELIFDDLHEHTRELD